jgi:hypothetical protein
MLGLALQHLSVAAAGLGQGAIAMQPRSFLQQVGNRVGHMP